jgi:hypothetical protein
MSLATTHASVLEGSARQNHDARVHALALVTLQLATQNRENRVFSFFFFFLTFVHAVHLTSSPRSTKRGRVRQGAEHDDEEQASISKDNSLVTKPTLKLRTIPSCHRLSFQRKEQV